MNFRLDQSGLLKDTRRVPQRNKSPFTQSRLAHEQSGPSYGHFFQERGARAR
jgi:hypothetical protein